MDNQRFGFALPLLLKGSLGIFVLFFAYLHFAGFLLFLDVNYPWFREATIKFRGGFELSLAPALALARENTFCRKCLMRTAEIGLRK